MLLLVGLVPAAALAQSGVISGTVTDETGEAIPGVNVVITQLTKGDATDIEGKYTITNVPAGTYTVTASFTGYKKYETTVQVGSGIVTLDITMEEDILGLDEVVITGYQTVSKREVSGAIAKVSSKEFRDVPVQSAQAILQGRAAGVQITTQSGNPGGAFTVNIRGAGSINSSSAPLYIIDGVQVSFANQSSQTSQTPLNAIDPNSIESIEVLKDAASASIYGANGANGVVIITTKKGSNTGRTNITARSEFGYREEINRFDVANSQEWIEYQIQARANTGNVFDFLVDNPANEAGRRAAAETAVQNILTGFGQPAGIAFADVPTTDWQDFIYDTGFSQRYTLTASGGDNDTQYFLNGGYEDTEGHIFNSAFTRYNLTANIDQRLNSKLRGSVQINLANTAQTGECQDGSFINCPVTASGFEPPVTFPFNADGTFANTRFGQRNNIALQDALVRRTNRNTQILGNSSLTYEFTNWLTFKTTFGVDYRVVSDNQFRPPIASTLGGQVFEADRETTNWSTNNVLSARRTFNEKHNVSGILGMEYRRERSNVFTSFGTGLPNGLLSVINATSTPNAVSGFNTEFRQAGYFARVNYDFDGKYILSGTARYDGSSRFGSEERWGFFPGGTAAWRLSEENFFKNLNWSAVEEVKLRVGYGTTGNSLIGNFAARSALGVGGSYNGLTGLTLSRLGNDLLTWEESEEINVGLDLIFFKGRLSANIDAYQRDNNELLLFRPLPRDSGFGGINENVGSVRNEGVELQLNSVNIDRGGLLWTSNFNISVQRNEILSLNQGQISLGGGRTPFAVGQARTAQLIPRWAGIHPANGLPLWFTRDGELTYNPVIGAVGEDDRVFQDGGEEDVVGGLGNTISYKGFTFDIFFQYSFGRTIFRTQEFFFGTTPIFTTGLLDDIERAWQQPGDVTDLPRVFIGSTEPGGSTADPRVTASNNSFQDASYIRLKNVTFSYNLPTSIVEKINLRGVRLYASGLNLYTWTAYEGLDPEQSSQSFPTALQVNGGIEINF